MKKIRTFLIAAAMLALGTVPAFAYDLISPKPGSTTEQGGSASEGGMIMLIVLVVAAAIIAVVILISRRSPKETETGEARPVEKPEILVSGATAKAAEETDSVNQTDAEITQTDAEMMPAGQEIFGDGGNGGAESAG